MTITTTIKVEKEIQLENSFKFLAKEVIWEAIDIEDKKLYYFDWEDIFPFLDQKLQAQYDSLIWMLEKYNAQEIGYDYDSDDEWELDYQNKEIAQFIDNYANLLFPKLTTSIKFHPQHSNVSINYVGLLSKNDN